MEIFDKTYYAGKNVVVTGAASGIGLALIELLLSCGAGKAVLADFNKASLDAHAQRLAAEYPGRIRGIVCDVTDEGNVKSMVDEAAEFFGGRIDLLINNAGKGFAGIFAEHSGLSAEVLDMYGGRVQSNEDWETAFALNFYGALYGCRAVIPYMLKSGGGQVLNIISGIAFVPMPMQSMYAASKAALMAMTLSLRAEYWDENIKFSPATPGTTATAIWKASGVDSTPAAAQSPQDSAAHILAGAAENKRLICGDEGDEYGARSGLNPDCATDFDDYLVSVARKRKEGNYTI